MEDSKYIKPGVHGSLNIGKYNLHEYMKSFEW